MENAESPMVGSDFGGTYEYYAIKDFDTCSLCENFSDNWHEERFECHRNTEKCERR